MKKSVILSAALVLSLAASSSVYADLPKDTVVIGNNAYNVRDLFKSSAANSVKQDLSQAKATDIYYTVVGSNYSGLSSLATGKNVNNDEIATTFPNGINCKDSSGNSTGTIAKENIQTKVLSVDKNYTVCTYVYGKAPNDVIPDFKSFVRYNDGTAVPSLSVKPKHGDANYNVQNSLNNEVGSTDVVYTLDDGQGHSQDVTVTVKIKPISEMKLSEIVNDANLDTLSSLFGSIYVNNKEYTWSYFKGNLGTLKDQIALSLNKPFEQLTIADLSNATLKLERSNGDKFEFKVDSLDFINRLVSKTAEVAGVSAFGQFTLPLSQDTINLVKSKVKDKISNSTRKLSEFLTVENLDKLSNKLSSITLNGKTYTEADIKNNIDVIKQKIAEVVGKPFEEIELKDLQGSLSNAKIQFGSAVFGRIFEIQLPNF